MRSRYFGPARPVSPKKDWLLDGFKCDSWSRDQSKPPPIYLRPRDEPDPPPVVVEFYEYIDSQGYPYDLGKGDAIVDMQANPEEAFYDLQGAFTYTYIDRQGYPYDLENGAFTVDLEVAQLRNIFDLD